MKILGILACVLLICMSTASATMMHNEKYKIITHKEKVTLHSGQSSSIFINETVKNKLYTPMDMSGYFGNNSFKKELISEDIHIQCEESDNKKYVLIDAIKPGKGLIIVTTYRYIFICNPLLPPIRPFLIIPVEQFFIKINVV